MAERDTAAAADAPDSADIVARLKLRMIDHCLPLGSTEGWDDKAGGFVDRLDRDGRADRLAPRRVFVQARQIYCYAKAAQMGWYPDGCAIALKGLEHLLSKAKAPDGNPGFVHTLKPDGTVLNPLRDSYDHAFVLLALASVYALDRDAQIRAEIDALCHFVDTQLRSPHGGVDEGDAGGNIRRHTRRLWPQTEIAKAWIAQAEAGEAGAADEARAALARLERHYLSHPVAGGWYDQFDRDGNSLVATIPASSFYHVLCAVAEAEQVIAK